MSAFSHKIADSEHPRPSGLTTSSREFYVLTNQTASLGVDCRCPSDNGLATVVGEPTGARYGDILASNSETGLRLLSP